jgi:hypothetical protein
MQLADGGKVFMDLIEGSLEFYILIKYEEFFCSQDIRKFQEFRKSSHDKLFVKKYIKIQLFTLIPLWLIKGITRSPKKYKNRGWIRYLEQRHDNQFIRKRW